MIGELRWRFRSKGKAYRRRSVMAQGSGRPEARGKGNRLGRMEDWVGEGQESGEDRNTKQVLRDWWKSSLWDCRSLSSEQGGMLTDTVGCWGSQETQGV